ncbi:MAG: hypothetical protein DRP42_07460, partial [Tenericutes bacterium]
MIYDIHKVSVDLQRTTDSDQHFRKNLREILVILLSKDKDDVYPWSEFSWRMSGTDNVRTDSFKTFAEYLKKWSQYTVGDFRDLFHDDNEIVSMLDAVAQNPDGAHHAVDNIHSTDRPSGTSKDAGLR